MRDSATATSASNRRWTGERRFGVAFREPRRRFGMAAVS